MNVKTVQEWVKHPDTQRDLQEQGIVFDYIDIYFEKPSIIKIFSEISLITKTHLNSQNLYIVIPLLDSDVFVSGESLYKRIDVHTKESEFPKIGLGNYMFNFPSVYYENMDLKRMNLPFIQKKDYSSFQSTYVYDKKYNSRQLIFSFEGKS